MGFGSTAIPSPFTRTVKTLHSPPEESVVSCLDDILASSSTLEEHLDALRQLSDKLPRAGLSVYFAKYNFATSSLEFLGMVIDSTGMRPAPSKIEAVAKMPRPTKIEELRPFLGLTSYLRQFVENYSTIASPLTDILRN